MNHLGLFAGAITVLTLLTAPAFEEAAE